MQFLEGVTSQEARNRWSRLIVTGQLEDHQRACVIMTEIPDLPLEDRLRVRLERKQMKKIKNMPLKVNHKRAPHGLYLYMKEGMIIYIYM